MQSYNTKELTRADDLGVLQEAWEQALVHLDSAPSWLRLEFRPVEDVSSSQHWLNSGDRRPLFAALLTSLLVIEPQCHGSTGAAAGTGF